MSLEQNTEFLSQKEDVEKLKKERAAKKAGKSKEEPTTLTIVEPDTITQELAKVNITEQVLQQLTEYKSLKVNGLEDKEGYEKVKAAQTLCRNTRVLAEKICKKGREAAIAEQRAWIKKEKEVSEQIEAVEAHLKAERDVIDKEKERQVAAREEAMKIRMQARTTTLLSFGAVFNGEVFTLQEGEEVLSANALDIKMTDDVQFNILQLKFEILYEKSKIRIAAEQEAAKIEAERVAAIKKQQEEEAARLEVIRIENEKKAAELKAQMDAIEEQKRQIERDKQKEIEIAAAAAKAKEDAEKEKQEALRLAEEKRLKDIADAEAKHKAEIAAKEKAEADRIAAEKKAAEEKIAADKAKVAAEARAKALLPDKQKLVDFAQTLNALVLPELTTEEGKKVMETLKSQHSAYSSWVLKQSEKLV